MEINLKNLGQFCFICGKLPFNETGSDKIGLFTATPARFSEWKKVVKSTKRGLLKANSRLCDCHFDPADIETGRIIGGVFHPYSGAWMKLKKGAVPKHFLGILLDELFLFGHF